MSNRINFYLGQLVTEADLDAIQSNLQESIRQSVGDQDISGVVQALGVSQVGLGTTMLVEISGPGIAYDGAGRRIRLSTSEQVDLSVDENAVSTTVVGIGNERYVSIFVEYDEVISNPQLDNNGTTVFVDISESYTIRVVQAAEAAAGTAPRPALIPGAILIADVLIANGTTGITDAMIETDDDTSTTSRFQWAFSATSSSPTQIRSRTLTDFAEGIVGALNDHINSVGTAHPLDTISFDDTNVPARYGNISGAAESQEAFDALLVDLPNETAALVAAAAAPLVTTYSVGRSGVVQGFTATATGGGSSIVTISAGVAMEWSAMGVTTPFAINTTTAFNFFADFDGADLWAVIELDTSTGTLSRRLGAAAATPVFPAGVTERIPLYYVYLDAGAGQVDQTDIVDCRGMLPSNGLGGTLWQFLQGKGGIEVSSLATSVDTAPMTAISPGGLEISTPGYSTFDLSDTNLWSSGESYAALAATDDIIHLYAALPTYPAGYDAAVNAVPRRMITTGTRIAGAMRNCVLLASNGVPPANSASGDPGSTATNNALWGTHNSMVYLGAVSHRSTGSVLRTQVVEDGIVWITSGVADRESQEIATISTTLDYTVAGPSSGSGGAIVPSTARTARVGIHHSSGASAGSVVVAMVSTATPLHETDFDAASTTNVVEAQVTIPGGMTATLAFTDGGGHVFRTWLNGYTDAILCLR